MISSAAPTAVAGTADNVIAPPPTVSLLPFFVTAEIVNVNVGWGSMDGTVQLGRPCWLPPSIDRTVLLIKPACSDWDIRLRDVDIWFKGGLTHRQVSPSQSSTLGTLGRAMKTTRVVMALRNQERNDR